MRSDYQEFADGVKLAAIAVVAAVLTATLVIGAGRGLLPSGETAAPDQPGLTEVAALR